MTERYRINTPGLIHICAKPNYRIETTKSRAGNMQYTVGTREMSERGRSHDAKLRLNF